ncbi:MAG: Spy/CpxP family protein refolding chaperone [Acidobacteria bacterium]|nr:Spy/CpxP family protein refolding chaperone [Acidobacteriota bacterium]
MKHVARTLGLLTLMISFPAAVLAMQKGTLQPLTPKASAFAGLMGAKITQAFWRSPQAVHMLGLTLDQQQKMEDIFHQYRIKLIDLNAALEKEEAVLEPLIAAGRPSPENEGKILVQIDRIADTRAELEKHTSRMLLGILQVLTPEQWMKLPATTKKSSLFFVKPKK